MARLELSLPEEFGTDGDLGRTAPERPQRDVAIARRTDGSGVQVPVIVRWFETWATGESVEAVGSP